MSHPRRHNRTARGPHGTADWKMTAVELFPSSSLSEHLSRGIGYGDGGGRRRADFPRWLHLRRFCKSSALISYLLFLLLLVVVVMFFACLFVSRLLRSLRLNPQGISGVQVNIGTKFSVKRRKFSALRETVPTDTKGRKERDVMISIGWRREEVHSTQWSTSFLDLNDFHFLDWWQQVVVMRFCTNHNRLNAHMSRKNKAGTITNLSLRS